MIRNKLATAILMAVIVPFFCCAFHAAAQRTDFSGHWVRNEEKTDYGTLSKVYYPQNDLKISQEANQLLITSESGTVKLQFDGAEDQKEVNGNGGPRTKRSTINWLSESSFLVAVSYTGSLTYGMTRTFSISEDGKTLTEKSHTDYKPLNSVYDATFTYEKK